jgi:hypothetical protein
MDYVFSAFLPNGSLSGFRLSWEKHMSQARIEAAGKTGFVCLTRVKQTSDLKRFPEAEE